MQHKVNILPNIFLSEWLRSLSTRALGCPYYASMVGLSQVIVYSSDAINLPVANPMRSGLWMWFPYTNGRVTSTHGLIAQLTFQLRWWIPNSFFRNESSESGENEEKAQSFSQFRRFYYIICNSGQSVICSVNNYAYNVYCRLIRRLLSHFQSKEELQTGCTFGARHG